jgi:hypothetical protein
MPMMYWPEQTQYFLESYVLWHHWILIVIRNNNKIPLQGSGAKQVYCSCGLGTIISLHLAKKL